LRFQFAAHQANLCSQGLRARVQAAITVITVA
jgi:hypothetical protein